ncbi:hypothetical protein [Streptomyces sp. NPDC058457]|uniref:hypothetical protein n=1 Tax=Streptomyces sp. NPDC058457 TaxID=3346507 RepID=UPI0036622D2A
MPVAGVAPLPDEAGRTECLTRRAPGLDVIIGITERETAAFYEVNPVVRRLREVPGVGPGLADGVEHVVGHFAFDRPSRRLAAQLSGAGARVWTYRFDYAAPDSAFGAARPEDMEGLSRRVRTAWLDFVRTGTPGTDTPWPQHTGHSDSTYHWSA